MSELMITSEEDLKLFLTTIISKVREEVTSAYGVDSFKKLSILHKLAELNDTTIKLG